MELQICLDRTLLAVVVLRRLRQEDHKLKTNLGFVVRLCLTVYKGGKIGVWIIGEVLAYHA